MPEKYQTGAMRVDHGKLSINGVNYTINNLSIEPVINETSRQNSDNTRGDVYNSISHWTMNGSLQLPNSSSAIPEMGHEFTGSANWGYASFTGSWFVKKPSVTFNLAEFIDCSIEAETKTVSK